MIRWWMVCAFLLLPYGSMIWYRQHDLAEAFCGVLAMIGLGSALFNFRRRDQVRRAADDLNLLASIHSKAVSDVDRRELHRRAEDGVLEGLLLSSYSAILIAFIRPLGHVLERVCE